MPVPLRVEEIVEVRPLAPQESTQQRTEEQIVDVPVRHVVEKYLKPSVRQAKLFHRKRVQSVTVQSGVGCRGRGSLSLFTSP